MTVETKVPVPPSATDQILKGQLRIALAAFAGMLVGKQLLPAGLVNDQLLDLAAGAALVALVSGWSWLRAKLTHSRFFSIATDPRVPDAVAKVVSK